MIRTRGLSSPWSTVNLTRNAPARANATAPIHTNNRLPSRSSRLSRSSSGALGIPGTGGGISNAGATGSDAAGAGADTNNPLPSRSWRLGRSPVGPVGPAAAGAGLGGLVDPGPDAGGAIPRPPSSRCRRMSEGSSGAGAGVDAGGTAPGEYDPRFCSAHRCSAWGWAGGVAEAGLAGDQGGEAACRAGLPGGTAGAAVAAGRGPAANPRRSSSRSATTSCSSRLAVTRAAIAKPRATNGMARMATANRSKSGSIGCFLGEVPPTLRACRLHASG